MSIKGVDVKQKGMSRTKRFAKMTPGMLHGDETRQLMSLTNQARFNQRGYGVVSQPFYAQFNH